MRMNRKQVANLVNCGYVAFLAMGAVLPLLMSRREDRQRGLRTLETLGTAALIGQGLKRLFPEERPDGTDRCSFPSTHTTDCFVIAAINSAFERKQSLAWYSGAVAVA